MEGINFHKSTTIFFPIKFFHINMDVKETKSGSSLSLIQCNCVKNKWKTFNPSTLSA